MQPLGGRPRRSRRGPGAGLLAATYLKGVPRHVELWGHKSSLRVIWGGREGAVHTVTPQHTSGETGHQALPGWGAACTWGLVRTTHQRDPAPLPPLTQAQAGCCGNPAPDHSAQGRARTPAGTSVLMFPRGPHR